MKRNEVVLCAISNISSGSCSEDCGFCTQSAKYHADIERFWHKPLETILAEAHKARQVGALGFCLVTAGEGLDDDKLDFVCRTAYKIKAEIPDFHLIACNGIAEIEALKELKKAGISSYNHNLETAQSFYPHVVSTLKWENRYQTCENAKNAGLTLCTGGIFGLGESDEQRREFLRSLASLSPMSSPLNFFIPNKSLPIHPLKMTKEEGYYWIAEAIRYLPQTMIMVAGGREQLFGKEWTHVLDLGVRAIIIGDYLTTCGEKPSNDLESIEKAGYSVALSCDFPSE